jgi:hypothetical protein
MRRVISAKWFIFLITFLFVTITTAQTDHAPVEPENKIIELMHAISSHDLYAIVDTLSSETFAGRLTGTAGYLRSAQWVASYFKKWGIEPAGDNHTYFQNFPNPYTLINDQGEVTLHMKMKKGEIKKTYVYEEDYYPGATSGSGSITADVVYVGYGITAPELGYDDYKGMDVKGKIVILEREVPVSSDQDSRMFMKWRPYSFHQYKLLNAVRHGARGMLYCYHIVNPNNAYDKNLIYAQVGDEIIQDIFQGTGKNHQSIVEAIKKKLKPRSFSTGKIVTIRNETEHHPEGIGINVVGWIPGNDPEKSMETLVIGAHLDHLGKTHKLMPGANDNCSGVAVLMAAAEALSKMRDDLNRSILFICFGAEEQGVVGSKFFLENPITKLENIIGFINFDGVGCGDKLGGTGGERFPAFWEYFHKANEQFIHRKIRSTYFKNLARPRLDTARFIWKGIPSITFYAYGAPSFYHSTKDNLSTITPEIMEDLSQLLFIVTARIVNADEVQFRENLDGIVDLNKME